MAQVLRPETIGAITRISNTQLTIGASYAIIGGQQRPTSLLTVTTSTSGINGLDTGTIAANQFYYIYLAINNGIIGGILSLSGSAPTGFAAYKLIGQCTTDASGFLVAANVAAVDNAPVGHVMSAMLSEPQFRAIHGAGWILSDGRTVTGTKYATVTGLTSVPDLRGMVLRGTNNGGSTLGTRADGNQDPDGVRAVGSFQSHAIQTHSHTFTTYGNVPAVTNNAASSSAGAGGTSGTSNNNGNSAAETRMRNVAVNHFIKIA